MMGSSRPKYVSSVRGILARFLFADRSFTSSKHRAGFTLVEVVASLLIVGILGAIAGMGLVTGLRGYMQAKENGHLAQKAQIAMARIKRELMEITDVIKVSNGTDPLIIFDNPEGRQALCEFGKTLQLCELESTITDFECVSCGTLIDQIDQEKPEENFKIEYFKGLKEWDLGNDIDSLSTIKVTFVLRREEGRPGKDGTVPFETTVSLRNTRNTGGATALTDNEYTRAASRYDCFIESACGDIFPTTSLNAKRAFLTVFLLWLFWITSFADCRRPERRQRKTPAGSSSDRNQSGHVLVALVVTLLLFAALGAGMVSLIGTSTTSQVAGDTANRAYYLAESGFRYAASRYLNATDANGICKSQDEKSQTLADLHEKSFTLSGDDGRFQLKIFPYFLTVKNTPTVGSSVVETRFSGGKPEEFTLPPTGTNARVKIGDTVYSYTSYNEDTGQLTLAKPLADFDCAEAVVRLIGRPASNTTITRSGDLILANGGFFPEIQGRINIHGVSYGYENRDGNVLHNVTMAQDPNEPFSISLESSTEVLLEPFLKVRSIGMVGQGDLAANREVVYNVPLRSSEKVVFRDNFNDLSNWSSPTYGSFAIETIDNENVLAVTAVEPGFGDTKAGLIAFNWTSKNIVNFAYAHRLAGYYLSYDAQVKIGFDETPFPDTGYGPEGSPIPQHYVAGLTFRLDKDENENFYGLSFLRGCAACEPADGIPDEIVPENDVNLIVLWQQTGNGTSRKWLAYGEPGLPLLFFDDAEVGPPAAKWIIENDHVGNPLWVRANNFARNPGGYSWTTSPDDPSIYDDPPSGETWNDYLISESIDLSQATTVQLTFWTRYRLSCEDGGFVEISDDDGSTWIIVNNILPKDCLETGNSEDISGNIDGWVKKTLDIPEEFIGNTAVRIRFRFERNCCTTSDGWWIDDIRVIQDFQEFPVNKSTLLVRIYEGAMVAFNSGGPIPIETGDIVSQSNGAVGKVIFPPVLTSGSWAGGNATGMLLLNNTSETDFASGLPLNKGATSVANVTAPPARQNWIQAYYGTEEGVSPPPTSPAPDDLYPYDQERLRNTFGTANWPPDPDNPPTGFNDYYTLVQWNDAVQEVDRLADNNGKYTIIASNQAELFTPTDAYFPFTRPEIGLQVAGQGGANVYFKDYAVKLGYAEQRAMIPIQQ